MKTLWIFGDSFSVDFENNHIDHFINYKNFKGYHPKSWGKIISEELNLTYKNYAQGGIDNHTILESFCNHITEIKPNDLVFIGWSPEERIRLVGDNGRWYSFNSRVTFDTWCGIDANLINTILYNRVDETGFNSVKVVSDEINSWENMINHTMKDMYLHIWRWYRPQILSKHYETIRKETNDLIQDDHWSEKGHKDYSIWLLNQINNQP